MSNQQTFDSIMASLANKWRADIAGVFPESLKEAHDGCGDPLADAIFIKLKSDLARGLDRFIATPALTTTIAIGALRTMVHDLNLSIQALETLKAKFDDLQMEENHEQSNKFRQNQFGIQPRNQFRKCG